jgi:hypothetical protein
MVPLITVTRWPAEFVLFILLTIALAIPLALFVLLVRTRIVSTVTGYALATAGVALPLPGYPQFINGNAGRWGYVLLLLPAILLGIWLISWLIDLVVRADRRLGDAGRAIPPAPPQLGPPIRRGVARGVASVAQARPPDVTVQYLEPAVPGVPDPTRGEPDPAPGVPDPAPGVPDPARGVPDPPPGEPDPAPGEPDRRGGPPSGPRSTTHA